jgi:hypothetical protein
MFDMSLDDGTIKVCNGIKFYTILESLCSVPIPDSALAVISH